MDIVSYLLGKNAGGGGSTAPHSLQELNNIIHSFDGYLATVVAQYDAYTDEPMTIYAPVENCTNFMIQKTSQGKYRIIWSTYGYYLKLLGVSQQAFCQINRHIDTDNYDNYKRFSTYDITLSSTGGSINARDIAYASAGYETLEELVTAMQTSTGITYSALAGSTFTYAGVLDDNWETPIVNIPIFDSQMKEIITYGKVLSHDLTILIQ